MKKTQVRSLGQEDTLEKEMAIHSSILAWKIPQMEERGRLQSMGSQRVEHDWATELNWNILCSSPFLFCQFQKMTIAAHCRGLLYVDMGYLLKRKHQEGRQLQAKELNPSGKLQETVQEGQRTWQPEFWLFRRANRDLGGEGNAVTCEYWECLPYNVVIPVCCLFKILQ